VDVDFLLYASLLVCNVGILLLEFLAEFSVECSGAPKVNVAGYILLVRSIFVSVEFLSVGIFSTEVSRGSPKVNVAGYVLLVRSIFVEFLCPRIFSVEFSRGVPKVNVAGYTLLVRLIIVPTESLSEEIFSGGAPKLNVAGNTLVGSMFFSAESSDFGKDSPKEKHAG